MSVYVGKDVTVKIQVPAEDEPHTIPSEFPYTVTLDRTSISDRDLDGVSNEIEHVTVKDVSTGNPIAPASVVDATGVVTFNSGDAGKNILVSYSYDTDPYLAQELSVEPKQTVEGIDTLGSDTVQSWAALQKEFAGSIKEVFKQGSKEQLARITEFKFNPCASANGGSATGTPGFDPFYPAWHTIDGVLSSCAITQGTAPYDWTLEVIFATRQKIDKVVLSMKLWLGHNTNLKIAYYDGFGWKDYVTLNENDFAHDGVKTKIYLGSVWTNKIRVQGTLDNQTYAPEIYEAEAYQTETPVYGMVVSWNQGGSAVKIGFEKVVFPEGSIPSPKDAPVFVVTSFRAQSAKTNS
jgi:hypothetical protein